MGMKMKKIWTCKIIANRAIAKDVYEMILTVADAEGMQMTGAIKPGQFINIYLDDKTTLLPRPISVCQVGCKTITIVYKVVGKGTKTLSHYSEGHILKVLSPLGNGYMLEESYTGKVAMLIGGGVGVPPMVYLAKILKEKGARVIAVLGFEEEPFLLTALEKDCTEVLVATDKGTVGFHGTVLDLIKAQEVAADICFACGPKGMLQALTAYCIPQGMPLQVSLEERMACGYGACVGCMCKTSLGQKSVCKDGPVFWAEEVFWNA